MSLFKLSSGSCTHTGMKREKNQDSFIDLPDLSNNLGLFVVADGMGGHLGGETASLMAVEGIEKYINELGELSGSEESIASGLKKAVEFANESIYAKGSTVHELSGMGTTTSALLITNAIRDSKPALIAVLGQVGDSRTYYIHNNNIWQLTRDHSLVNERLRAGLITREQSKTEKNKNVLTRAVGYEKKVECDTFWIEPKPGDIFMLCSDGLHGLVDDKSILSIINENQTDLKSAAQALIDEANKNGGNDNITAVIVRVEK